MSRVADEIAEQRASNRSSRELSDDFATHRQQLTALVRARTAGGRLCVLGAGNCNDLDLAALAEGYREIHLVDVDPEALSVAVERQPPAVQTRLFRHAPLDLSGLVDRLERWARFQVTPGELIAHAETTAEKLAEALPSPFDVVLSACVLTQMQLMVVNVLGDRHPLFEATRHTLSLTHLRTLLRLQGSDGRALLATDLSCDRIAPFGDLAGSEDCRRLMDALLSRGQVFQASHPGVLRAIADDDPKLHREAALSEVLDVWPWRNGANGLYLVYALELSRRAS